MRAVFLGRLVRWLGGKKGSPMPSRRPAGGGSSKGGGGDYSGREYVKGAPLTSDERAAADHEARGEEYRNDF